jgi:hypothetical protein
VPLEWSDRRGPLVRRAIGSVGRTIIACVVQISYSFFHSIVPSHHSIIAKRVRRCETRVYCALFAYYRAAPIGYQRDTRRQLPADTVLKLHHLSLVDLVRGNGRQHGRQHS